MTLKVGELFGTLNLDDGPFHKTLREADSGISKLAKMGAKAAVGAGLAVAGVAAVAAGAVLKIGMSYQDSLNVFQSVSGANAAQMQMVADTAKALGNDLTLPGISAADAATAMTQLAKAGLNVEQSMAAAKGVLQLSKAAETDVGTAADMTASALNAFSLSGDQAVRIADLLAAAANSSMGEITDMGFAMSQSASIFAAAGVSVEDLTTSISMLAQKGILGSDAGTSLKTMLMSLQPDADGTNRAFQKLGVSIYDSSGKMRAYRDIISDMSGALSSLTQEQRDQALQYIFGSDAARAANIIFGQSVDVFDKMRDSVTKQGVAADVAAARSRGLSGAWENIKSTLETMALTIYDNVSGPIEEAIRKAGDALGNLSSKLGDIWSKKDLTVTAKLEASWDQFDKLLMDFGVAGDDAERIKSSVEAVAHSALALGYSLAGVGDLLKMDMWLGAAFGTSLSSAITEAANVVIGVVNDIMGAFQALSELPGIPDSWRDSVNNAADSVDKLNGNLGRLADQQGKKSIDYWNSAAGAAAGATDNFKNAGVQFGATVNSIANTPVPPQDPMAVIKDRNQKDLDAMMNSALMAGPQISTNLGSGIASTASNPIGASNAMRQNVENQLWPLPGTASGIGANTGASLGAGVGSQAPVVRGHAAGLAGAITGALNIDLTGRGSNIIQTLINGLGSMFGPLGQAAAAAAQIIFNHLPHSPAKMGPLSGTGSPYHSGLAIGSLLAGGILANSGKVYGAMGQLTGGMSLVPVSAGGGFVGSSSPVSLSPRIAIYIPESMASAKDQIRVEVDGIAQAAIVANNSRVRGR